MRKMWWLVLALVACDDGGGKKDGSRGGDSGTAGTDDPDPITDPIELGLFPTPATLTLGDGWVELDDASTVWADGDGVEVAELLVSRLRTSTGLPLPISDGDGSGAGPTDIVLSIDFTSAPDPEAYTLRADETGVHVVGAGREGLFWGTQTLHQLLPAANLAPSLQADVAWRLPMVEIADAPTYPWRGGMIDVARHFYDVAAIERQIDLFALHKLNRLHLHLTDDQGWRIEIQSWPDLAIIGGATEVGGGAGGYYTQDEYVGIVEYAAARGIMVIPEIDFPGHAHAALASYAELNESGQREEPYTGTAVITTPLWLDSPDTYEMVEDVWTEVAALTPGPYVHVGGDEAIDYTQPEYAAFMQWLQEVVEDQGKLLIGWDEIGEGDLSAPYISQFWWQDALAREASSDGADLIYSWASRCYLDMQYDAWGEFGQVWAGYVDTRLSYQCQPELSGVAAGRWLGVEGPLWTEYVATEDQVDFMLWPRLSTIAEVGWSPPDRLGWVEARERLGRHGARFEALGVAFNPDRVVDWSLGDE